MAAEAAAYRDALDVGERFSLAIRHALFEDGLDVSNEAVLAQLCGTHGVPQPDEADRSAVLDDFEDGKRRDVAGSPHFFTAAGDFFCPSLDIEHDNEGYEVSFDTAGFKRFVAAAFGRS